MHCTASYKQKNTVNKTNQIVMSPYNRDTKNYYKCYNVEHATVTPRFTFRLLAISTKNLVWQINPTQPKFGCNKANFTTATGTKQELHNDSLLHQKQYHQHFPLQYVTHDKQAITAFTFIRTFYVIGLFPHSNCSTLNATSLEANTLQLACILITV